MFRPATCAAGVLALGACASAGVILDASFFDTLPTTLITFETDGAGADVNLIDGQTMAMPGAEYAGLGVTFDPAVEWVNDGNAIVSGAITLGGSPDNAIHGADSDLFSVEFSVPVRSFGFWIVNNAGEVNRPVLTAYDALDNPLETVTFEGAAVDGDVGTIEWGFLGIWRPELIARVEISKDFALFDNLRFSSETPAPGALGLGALSVAAFVPRRRRG